jgi:LPXTG-motif cell wall-anchored protein
LEYVLRFFAPPYRRLVTLTGALLVGLAAATAVAAPASAHPSSLDATTRCDQETHKWVIKWTLTNGFTKSAVLSDVSFKPNGSAVSGDITNGRTLAAKGSTGDSLTGTEVVNGSATGASLTLTLTFSDQVSYAKSKDITFSGTCVAPTPSTSPSVPAPTPSPSRSAATPGLPTTGSSGGTYALGALALVGTGTGLFLFARRRRMKFVA